MSTCISISISLRDRHDQAQNTLDLALSNEESIEEEAKEQSPLGKSDHVVTPKKIRCYADAPPIVKTMYSY